MASVWIDPVLPGLDAPADLKSRWFSLGSAKFQLLPKQWQFLTAPEEMIGYLGGVGSGKTRIGAIKSAILSTQSPNNRGLVGRFALPDLEDTSQRDLLDFLREAELLKEAPNSRTKRALVYCLDPKTGAPLGQVSEISFQHLDDPDHLRGRHLGWFWIDEGSELKNSKAWAALMGRLRLPTFRGRYKGFVTGNPRGRNWIYDMFFNDEAIQQVTCGRPDCRLTDRECNEAIRRKRRGVHCTSYENYFLPPEYIENMVASYSEEQRKREIEAAFDVFEGQVFKEWDESTHVFEAPQGWPNGMPPAEWDRILAIDVGGATPWALVWSAIDPDGNIIFYDEVYKATTDVREIAGQAAERLLDERRERLHFRHVVIDYENKVAAADLQRELKINISNAQKTNKLSSVIRFASYLHPNPRHCYPEWHPRAGQPGAPRAYVATRCRNLRKELPQQRWKENVEGDVRDEMDRLIPNHATDCCLYTSRLLPEPTKLPVNSFDKLASKPKSKISQLYWADQIAFEERKAKEGRRPYRGGGRIILTDGIY